MIAFSPASDEDLFEVIEVELAGPFTIRMNGDVNCADGISLNRHG
jgi:hypothetical protein